MKHYILTFLFCLIAGINYGQSNGDYRTRTSGNWNQLIRWQVFYNGSWENVTNISTTGPYYNVLPSDASGVITLNHSMDTTTTFSLGGTLQTVKGNLTFISTGATPREVRLKNGGAGYNLTIGGDFIIQDGAVTLAQNLTSATSISVVGNLNISGGSLILGTSNNSATHILLNGALQKTGGILSRGTGTGACTILPYHTASN